VCCSCWSGHNTAGAAYHHTWSAAAWREDVKKKMRKPRETVQR
jgi:hypothetical protein